MAHRDFASKRYLTHGRNARRIVRWMFSLCTRKQQRAERAARVVRADDGLDYIRY